MSHTVADCQRCDGEIEQFIHPRTVGEDISYECNRCGAEPAKCSVCGEYVYEYVWTKYTAAASPSRSPEVGYSKEYDGHVTSEIVRTCKSCDPDEGASPTVLDRDRQETRSA